MPLHTHNNMRSPKQKEHLHRAQWMDYQEPSIQLLTLVTTDRLPLFGELQGEIVVLTALGQRIAKEIEHIPTYRDASAIEIYSYVIMPDHVHILLRIHERLPKHLGQYIRWFKIKCSDAYKELHLTPAPDSSTRCSDTSADSPMHKIWPFAPEYHDRVLSGKNQLVHMSQYIRSNPHRLAMKRANKDLFTIHQHTQVAGIVCTTLGNLFLADYPQRQALHCSRSLSQEQINVLKEEYLVQAANGTVFISASISEGEKQICRALNEAGFPLIVLLGDGFPTPDSPHYRYYKPNGTYFEACAAGKLLLVEPDKQLLDSPDIAAIVAAKAGNIPHETKRYRFLALNAIADKMSTANANEPVAE